MLRSCAWLSVMMFAGSGLLLSGCAEQGPKPGGVTTVSPATKPGTPADSAAAPKTTPPATTDTPAEEKKSEEIEPTPPPDAGSTTGGGTETPGDGQ